MASPNEFFNQVKAEARKVVWPTRQETTTTAIFVALMMLILSVFFLPLLFAVGVVVAGGFASGALLGYAGYMLVHHASHHWTLKPGSLLYKARVLHMAHHYNSAPGNYGVVTSFWDHVFSTNVDRRRRAIGT